jgi:hypothetical protein
MERRSFLKFLSIIPLAPKVSIDILASIKTIVRKPLTLLDYLNVLKKNYGPIVEKQFTRRTMMYDEFVKTMNPKE